MTSRSPIVPTGAYSVPFAGSSLPIPSRSYSALEFQEVMCAFGAKTSSAEALPASPGDHRGLSADVGHRVSPGRWAYSDTTEEERTGTATLELELPLESVGPPGEVRLGRTESGVSAGQRCAEAVALAPVLLRRLRMGTGRDPRVELVLSAGPLAGAELVLQCGASGELYVEVTVDCPVGEAAARRLALRLRERNLPLVEFELNRR